MVKQKRSEDGQSQGREKIYKRSSESQKCINHDVVFSKPIISDIVAQVSITSTKSRAIFVLENASLKKGFVRKKRKILSAFEDADFLTKQGKNPNDYRPDIFYEALRAILDSPLNKAGMVGAVYVKTYSGVLFEVKPHTRIPRTCKRFCGVMLELLEKSCVSAKDTGEVLIQVLKQPLMHYIPKNSHVIGLSYSSQKVVDIEDYLSSTGVDSNFVFMVGTMVKGSISKESKADYISVSDYPLSAKYCVGLICEALEQKWKIF